MWTSLGDHDPVYTTEYQHCIPGTVLKQDITRDRLGSCHSGADGSVLEDLKLKCHGVWAGLSSTEGHGACPFSEPANGLLIPQGPAQTSQGDMFSNPSCKIHASLLLVPLTLCSPSHYLHHSEQFIMSACLAGLETLGRAGLYFLQNDPSS